MGRIPTVFYCAYANCTASFNRKHRLETHTRSHTGERPFKCCYENCDKSFRVSSHLKRHEESHASPVKCTEKNCCEVFKTRAYLKRHLKGVHLKIKRCKTYSCTHCSRVFNKHNTLQRHILGHTGEQPYKCSVEDCKKQFNTPSKLKRHMKIHEGYPCKMPNCDRKFEKWSLYVQHTRDDHRIEHKCGHCEKVFSSSYALRLHTPSHDELRKVYLCQVQNCSRYYFAKKNLDWHMRHYHAKRPYTCEVKNCHRAFKTEAELADHMIWGRRGHGKGWKRKNKPKQHKPSFAALLSGCEDIKRVNRKPAPEPKSTEIQEESDASILSDKFNASTVESATTSTEPEVSFSESSQPSSAGDVMVPACFTENNVNSTVCETNDSWTEVRTLESNAFTFATIEVIGGENSSQIIAVPVINATSDKYWKESGAFLVQQVS